MNVAWKIRIHKLVLPEDFKSISPAQQKIIFKAIHKKLSSEPKIYGKPLSGELKGYWRLRVGDYRVIYKILDDTIEVLVIKAGIRKDEQAYNEMTSRFKKLHDHYFS